MTAAVPLTSSVPGVKKHLTLSSEGTTAILAGGLMAVIAMMVLPLPSVFLDLGLTFSFALAILVLAVVIFIDRPLD
ncbi:MAG: FHIPEP family type III secretion protein, partial [Parvularculaceae bacterium]|nr:FHIPEP family type III secretion protein [Parvularculaceae bacterium]